MKNLFTVIVLLSITFTSTIFGQTKEIKYPIQELLQGKWVNLDDETNFLVFDSNHRKEILGDTTYDEDFVISNKCMNEGDEINDLEKEKSKYISCLESDLCWYIIKLDSNILSLGYVSRGNILKYKKIE